MDYLSYHFFALEQSEIEPHDVDMGKAAVVATSKGDAILLTVGDKFPEFKLQAVVSLEKGQEFQEVTETSFPSKWKFAPAAVVQTD